MTTLTIQLDETILEKAQQLAEVRHASVDEAVSFLIESASVEGIPNQLRGPEERRRSWNEMLTKIGRFDTGGPYSRDEMNER